VRALRGLIEAAHAGPTVLVTAFAAATAAASGLGAAPTATVGFAVLLGQLSIGWSNDWWDARDDLSTARADKPIVAGLVTERAVRRGAFIAATLCVPVSLALGWRAGLIHLLAVASGWSYNLGLKATLLSWLPYALSFGLLPGVVALALPGHPRPDWSVVAASALVGVAAHLTNGVKDLDADAATGIRGLPQRLGIRVATLLSAACVVDAVAVLVVARTGVAAVALGVLAVALALCAVARALQGRADGLFGLSMAAAAPVVITMVVTGGVR